MRGSAGWSGGTSSVTSAVPIRRSLSATHGRDARAPLPPCSNSRTLTGGIREVPEGTLEGSGQDQGFGHRILLNPGDVLPATGDGGGWNAEGFEGIQERPGLIDTGAHGGPVAAEGREKRRIPGDKFNEIIDGVRSDWFRSIPSPNFGNAARSSTTTWVIRWLFSEKR